MTGKKKPAIYTREFQENAVRLSKLPNRTLASVAQELKIPAWKLRNWATESKQQLERSEDVGEIIRLEKALKEAQEEIVILKKAMAYFAKSQS
jgi:transposase-like protein